MKTKCLLATAPTAFTSPDSATSKQNKKNLSAAMVTRAAEAATAGQQPPPVPESAWTSKTLSRCRAPGAWEWADSASACLITAITWKWIKKSSTPGDPHFEDSL